MVKVTLLSVASVLFGLLWRPVTDTLIRMLLKRETFVVAWVNRYTSGFDQGDWPSLIPYGILAVVIFLWGRSRIHRASVIMLLCGLFGASILPMLVEISTWIYRYSPDAVHGGYTGDVLAGALAFIGSFVTLAIGIAIGAFLTRGMKKEEQSR
jgi:hypothetical protein